MNNTIYKKTLNLGKIDYNGTGRAVNAVTIEVELRQCGGEKTFTIDKATKERIYTDEETERYMELSICGNIWNGNHSDIVCGGQCLDTIAKYIHTAQFREIRRIWKRWHLNGLRAGTPEQTAAIKAARAIDPKRTYEDDCNLLKIIDLYEVEYKGKPYKYGHAWIHEELPADVIATVKAW